MVRNRPTGLEVEELEDEGVHTLALTGELDLAGAPVLQRRVARLCAADGTRGIALDMNGLLFIDSTGLAAIIHSSRLCEREECAFWMNRGSDVVQRLFELTGVAGQLPVRGDEPESGQD